MERRFTAAVVLLCFGATLKGSLVPTGSPIGALLAAAIIYGCSIGSAVLLWSVIRQSLAEAIADEMAKRFPRGLAGGAAELGGERPAAPQT